MGTRMWLAAYAGAARRPGELRLKAWATGLLRARGLLSAIDDAGRVFVVEPMAESRPEWSLAVGPGPILTFQTREGPVTVGPTRQASEHRPAEFHLALVAAAADPATGEEGAVLVRLARDGQPLTAVGPQDNGGVVADHEVEAPGKSLDLYLEA